MAVPAGADGVPPCCEVKAANTLPSGASVAIAVMNALLLTGNASRSRTRSLPEADGAGGAGTLTAVGLEVGGPGGGGVVGARGSGGLRARRACCAGRRARAITARGAPGNQQRRAADHGDGKEWTHSGIVGEAARQAPYVVA